MMPIEIQEYNHRIYQPIIYAKDQPQYIPLPAIKSQYGTVITKWKLTWKERFRILLTGELGVLIKTFNDPIQPIKLIANINEWTK